MAISPEVQRKAQLEIDDKIGRDRLPTIEDRDALPYIRAIVSEALRWHPVTPLVTPHATTEDIEYRNYVIPKGSTIVPNAWYVTWLVSMAHISI
jgi:cytochrome P450